MSARSLPALAVTVALLGGALPLIIAVRSSPRGAARAPFADATRLRLGERIYTEGVLPSGEPLHGRLAGGGELVGALAACVRCHRRSGMGTVEGNRIIPPITGRFLYQSRAQAPDELDDRHTRGPDLAHALGRNRARPSYSDATLARAIREGIDSSGAPLDLLMPRFVLDEPDARLLIDYLAQQSDRWSPGVTRDTIHFATVVAPGVEPARRQALYDVLAGFFAARNARSRLGARREEEYAASAHNRYRAWELHVWELSGAPDTWAAQLDAYQERQPVFALLSGVSAGPWAPVQQFCERRRVPCWFPTVDLPVAGDGDFYSVYFSRGVLLEAELLARRLKEPRGGVRRVIEIRRDDATAAGAAQALWEALRSDGGVRVEERILRTVDAAALRRATADATGADVLVFWLRAADVGQLAAVPPPRARLFFSATLGGGEQAPPPPAWRAQARLLYPFALPEERRAKLARFHAWLQTRRLPLVDERLQADAYLACVLMAEKVDEMLESLYGDYLLERAEAILSMRLPTAMYHRLSLGPGQRFASKGGYIARFAGGDGSALVADSDFIIP